MRTNETATTGAKEMRRRERRAFGVCLFDACGRVLLRKPTGEYDGYAWTFPKGGAEHGDGDATTAVKECVEETGFVPEIAAEIDGAYRSGTDTVNHYFLGRPVGYDPAAMDDETEATAWVSYREAVKMILSGWNHRGMLRDLAVLNAAFDAYEASELCNG